MRGAVAIGLWALSVLPGPLAAKGVIVKIELAGTGLRAPLALTGPEVAGFNVFAGPGVVVNGVQQTQGFIIDWAGGIVPAPPAGLRQYEVSFYTGCAPEDRNCREEPRIIYQAGSAYHPTQRQGFVYLPGGGDPEFQFNFVMWHGHGLEGHWFRATEAWERYVRPLIAGAMR